MASPSAKSVSPGPGRPREFEIGTAVEDAMQVFWTRGYDGASIEDLIEGTGLSRGSLYKAFGDKHGLFLAALGRYTEENVAALRIQLEAEDALGAIEGALLLTARTSALAEGRRGCLLVASTTELGAKDKEVLGHVRRTFATIEGLLREAIIRGQASGEISDRRDPRSLSRFLLCTIEGMGVLGKTGRRVTEMEEIAGVAVDALRAT